MRRIELERAEESGLSLFLALLAKVPQKCCAFLREPCVKGVSRAQRSTLLLPPLCKGGSKGGLSKKQGTIPQSLHDSSLYTREPFVLYTRPLANVPQKFLNFCGMSQGSLWRRACMTTLPSALFNRSLPLKRLTSSRTAWGARRTGARPMRVRDLPRKDKGARRKKASLKEGGVCRKGGRRKEFLPLCGKCERTAQILHNNFTAVRRSPVAICGQICYNEIQQELQTEQIAIGTFD